MNARANVWREMVLNVAFWPGHGHHTCFEKKIKSKASRAQGEGAGLFSKQTREGLSMQVRDLASFIVQSLSQSWGAGLVKRQM